MCLGGSLRERIFAQASVRMIEYAEARAGCAGRGDVGNVKNGLSSRVGEYLAGVDSLAAANCENHVRVRNFWLEHLNILDRCFAAVPERTDDFDSGFFSRCDYLVLRCGECVLAADYRRLFCRMPGRFLLYPHMRPCLPNIREKVFSSYYIILSEKVKSCYLHSGCSLMYFLFLYTPTVRNGTTTMAMARYPQVKVPFFAPVSPPVTGASNT